MTTYKDEEINAQEAIEQLQNAKDLIQINGKDYFDSRDLPILDMAIEALGKRVPKEPVEEYIFRGAFREHLKKHAPDMADSTDYKCPVCGRRIRIGKESSSYGRRDNFCQRCGQAIDWSQNNE